MINLLGNRVAVEKLKKKSQGAHGGIIIPDSEEYLGIVRYVGPSANINIAVGHKVYFSTNYQQCRMDGKDLCVMEDKEIFATVQD